MLCNQSLSLDSRVLPVEDRNLLLGSRFAQLWADDSAVTHVMGHRDGEGRVDG